MKRRQLGFVELSKLWKFGNLKHWNFQLWHLKNVNKLLEMCECENWKFVNLNSGHIFVNLTCLQTGHSWIWNEQNLTCSKTELFRRLMFWKIGAWKLNNSWIGRLLMVNDSWLMAQGSWLTPQGSWIKDKTNLAPEPSAWGTQRQFFLRHEPRALGHEPWIQKRGLIRPQIRQTKISFWFSCFFIWLCGFLGV